MDELLGTIEWVAAADLSSVVDAVQSGASSPLVAVGSGGSLSAATHLSRLHRASFGETGDALTPYGLCSSPIALAAHHWIFSAGGSNPDVVAAVRACVMGEATCTNIVTMKQKSKVDNLTSGNPSVEFHVVRPPSRRDGFLATNSLLAFCALMSRAYLRVLAKDEQWVQTVTQLKARVLNEDAEQLHWRAVARELATVDNLIVLHDSGTSLGAFDLESKLTEAGVKNVQLADYRHFAHGRHHWLAKNPTNSGVLAFSSSDESLAKRTLELLPPSIPTATIQMDGTEELVQLLSLLAAFYITEELAFSRGIDPGQPGVPEFGRKVYRLHPTRARTTPLAEVAICRKLSLPRRWKNIPAGWRDAYSSARARAQETVYGGLVLDYDGTVVDTRDRFALPGPQIVSELVRLLDGGLQIGIATGRGRSAGSDLRAVIPSGLWSQVMVGYYNGAETKPLQDDVAPDRTANPPEVLSRLHAVLEQRKLLRDGLAVEVRPHQLTISGEGIFQEDALWFLVKEIAERPEFSELSVLRSSHSVDVIAPGISKLAVVREISNLTGAETLRIGDRGRWPGNDYELLASSSGLSVDQVSSDPATCWNFAPQGLRGTQATRFLLRSLNVDDGALRLVLGSA